MRRRKGSQSPPLLGSVSRSRCPLHPALPGLGPEGSYSRGIYVPPLSSVVRRFSDKAALESFVRDKNYGTAGLLNGSRVFAAIVFNSARPRLDYSIRMNDSEVPSTSDDPVSTLALATDTTYVTQYLESKISTTGPPFANNGKADAVSKAPRPGFLSLQLLVDRWALNTPATSPPDLSALLNSLFYALVAETASISEVGVFARWLSTLSPSNISNLGAAVGAWMLPSEGRAPQTVDLVPFPTPQLTTNSYSSTMINVFGIIFVMGILLPVATNTRAIVREREEKLREAILMVGVSGEGREPLCPFLPLRSQSRITSVARRLRDLLVVDADVRHRLWRRRAADDAVLPLDAVPVLECRLQCVGSRSPFSVLFSPCTSASRPQSS